LKYTYLPETGQGRLSGDFQEEEALVLPEKGFPPAEFNACVVKGFLRAHSLPIIILDPYLVEKAGPFLTVPFRGNLLTPPLT
jgi:hypothetical protein